MQLKVLCVFVCDTSPGMFVQWPLSRMVSLPAMLCVKYDKDNYRANLFLKQTINLQRALGFGEKY